jgi:hypothetical protein
MAGGDRRARTLTNAKYFEHNVAEAARRSRLTGGGKATLTNEYGTVSSWSEVVVKG